MLLLALLYGSFEVIEWKRTGIQDVETRMLVINVSNPSLMVAQPCAVSTMATPVKRIYV